MPRIRIIVFAAALLALAATAQAQAQTAAACTFSTHVTLSPGVSTTPSTGTFTTGGQTGTIDCQGVIAGAMITGPGTVGYSGSYGTGLLGPDDCAQGGGSGTFDYTIPTTAGAYGVSGGFTFQRVALAGEFTGRAEGAGYFAGVFEFTPDEGQDCVNVPVTSASVTGQAVLAG